MFGTNAVMKILASEVFEITYNVLSRKLPESGHVVVKEHSRPQRVIRFSGLIYSGSRFVKHQLSRDELLKWLLTGYQAVRRITVDCKSKAVVHTESMSKEGPEAIGKAASGKIGSKPSQSDSHFAFYDGIGLRPPWGWMVNNHAILVTYFDE